MSVLDCKDLVFTLLTYKLTYLRFSGFISQEVQNENNMDVFLCYRCRRGQMSLQLNSSNSFQNPERLNLPSPTLTTHLTGTPLPPGHALLTCPLVASHPHCDHFQKALLQHPALLPALPQQPLTRLPSVLLHLRCPRGLSPRTRG